MTRRWRLGAATFAALALATAACGSDGSTTDDHGGARHPGGHRRRAPGVRPSASSSSARRTTSATTRPPTRAARQWRRPSPTSRCSPPRTCPRPTDATRVMEDMIAKGAKIIFATSYGHLDPAPRSPPPIPTWSSCQQGNLIEGNMPANFGTYFGTVYEPVYLAGIAAGKATKSNKLGYVYAFPIPQTLANISAFELGAKSVNPEAKTYVVNTSNWCDPAKQAEAANSLIVQGVDVITQHQDCTKTVIETDRGRRGDDRRLPRRRLGTRAEGLAHGIRMEVGPDLHRHRQDDRAGKFTGSKYNANYRVGYKNGDNPFVQSKFGPSVTTRPRRSSTPPGTPSPARRLALHRPAQGPGRQGIFPSGTGPTTWRSRARRASSTASSARSPSRPLIVHPSHVLGTRPYPWPYDGVLDPARLALVIAGGQALVRGPHGRQRTMSSAIAQDGQVVRRGLGGGGAAPLVSQRPRSPGGCAGAS